MADIRASAVFIPEIWSKEILSARERNLVMAKNVMRLDSDVATRGDTIRLPRVANRVALLKQVGTSVAFRATTEGEAVIGITSLAYDADIVEDMAAIQSQYNLMSIYTEKFGYSIAARVDSDLYSLHTGIAQTVGSVSSSVGLAYTFLTRANRLLDQADAPRENRYLLVDPIGYEQLLRIDNFVRYDAVGMGGGENAIRNGKVGRIFGIEVLTSNQVTAHSMGFGLMWQRDAFALAMQRDVQVKTQYSPRDIGTELVVWNLYGHGTIRADHAAVVHYGTQA